MLLLKTHYLSTNEDIDILHIPVELVDTAGCSFDELQNPETLSLSNKGEADLLFKHLDLLLQQYVLSGESTKIDVGIISPYKEQIELLKEKLADFDHSAYPINELAVKTIDGFQGEECDVIYISLVRSNPTSEIGFLIGYSPYECGINTC
jgi:ATP-dependent RNA/DNA helicase IGHMBP2